MSVVTFSLNRMPGYNSWALSIFRIFRKRKEEERRVPIDELDSWLVSRINDELSDVYAEAENVRIHLQESLDTIRQIIEETEGTGSKRALIAAINKVADLASLEVLSFDDILRLQEHSSQDLTRIGEIWYTYKRGLQKEAKNQVLRIHMEFKRIGGEIARLNKIIDVNSARAAALRRSQDQSRVLGNLIRKIRETIEKVKELESDLHYLESEQRSIESRIGSIRSTSEYQASASLRRELSTLEDRRMKITSEVFDGFSVLARPLGKYCYIADLSKEMRQNIHSYINETSKALSSVSDTIIKDILDDLRKAILQERIEIKNPQKVISNIEKMITELPKSRQEYLKLTYQRDTIQSKADTTVEEDVRQLEIRLKEIHGAIEKKRLESKEIKEMQTNLNSSINTKVSQLEQALCEDFAVPLKIQIMPDL